MKQPVVQQHAYGCAAACLAFVTGCRYQTAAWLLGGAKAMRQGTHPKFLTAALSQFGCRYQARFLNKSVASIKTEATIVLIKPDQLYRDGHYLVQHYGYWMDSWINLVRDRLISRAKAGYRKDLPGEPVYGLFPDEPL